MSGFWGAVRLWWRGSVSICQRCNGRGYTLHPQMYGMVMVHHQHVCQKCGGTGKL